MKGKARKFVNSRYSTHCLLLLFVVAIFVLCLFFIKSEDDYTYLERFNVLDSIFISLRFGNGRYLGNFFCRLCINRFFIDRIFRTLCFIAIILLTSVLTFGYKKRGLLLSGLLFLGMSNDIFAQVIVWGSGFYNYVPSIMLSLFSVYLLKRFYTKEISRENFVTFLLLCTGFCQQLFIENCTTINTLLSIAILFFVCRKKEISKKPALVYAIASVIGAVVMFTLPKILGVSHKMDMYRKINGISEYISNGIENGVRIINDLSEQPVLWAILSLALMLLLYKSGKTIKCSVAVKSYLCLYPLLSVVQMFNHNTTVFLTIDVAFLIYCALCVYTLLNIISPKKKKLFLMMLCFIALTMVQLLIVKPCRARCIFLPYVILTVLIMMLMERVLKQITIPVKKTIISLLSMVVVIIFSAQMFIYVNICNVNSVRMKYIDEQMQNGKHTVEIIKIPYEDWVHCGNESYVWPVRFNHGDKDAMRFRFIDYEEYMNR